MKPGLLIAESSERLRMFFGEDLYALRFHDHVVRAACFTHTTPTLDEHFAWLERQDPKLFYFLLDRECVRFVGVVRGTILSPGIVEIHLVLHEDYRGKSVGGWAVKHFCQAMEDRGIKEVRACVKQDGVSKRYVFWMRNHFTPMQTRASGRVWLRRKLG